MSQLSLGFQALYMCSHSVNVLERAVDYRTDMRSLRVIRHMNKVQYVEPQEDHTFLSPLISVTVQLRIQMFLVRSVYFNLRNILPKSGTFLPGHPVYLITFIFMAKLFKLK